MLKASVLTSVLLKVMFVLKFAIILLF